MKPEIPEKIYDFVVYSWGLYYASICTSLSLKETEERLNIELPTGIKSQWKKAEEDFHTGQSNPCPCERYPETHKHYLFVC